MEEMPAPGMVRNERNEWRFLEWNGDDVHLDGVRYVQWPGSLDAAWAEAEAGLPEGHSISGVARHYGADRVTWSATAIEPGPIGRGDPIVTTVHAKNWIIGEGDTPAAALRALAAKLQKRG